MVGAGEVSEVSGIEIVVLVQYLEPSFKTGHQNHTINHITDYVKPRPQDSGATALVYCWGL